ncbi:hypothetical protein FA10DRAFT_281838 [Acaromyces ingoldii]|uniref:Uncharacterized protein n=1 Tax=Acaromyces ingoldii TaxID=215250 RepID=A0A316YBZ4_9BASI|nr:hypothetical protein FA10DRAFT_281838 [Acaromyces ingoldii]PWN87046.1 hypothetical protein FA10DRAFT_281838 [Acaromyces ingoldii]
MSSMFQGVIRCLRKPNGLISIENVFPAISAGVSSAGTQKPSLMAKPTAENILKQSLQGQEIFNATQFSEDARKVMMAIPEGIDAVDVTMVNGEITKVKTVVKRKTSTDEQKPSNKTEDSVGKKINQRNSIDRTQYPPFGIKKPVKEEATIFPGRKTVGRS